MANTQQPPLRIEWILLGLLALMWGSSYLLINIAVREIPPLTLVAARVCGAAFCLLCIMRWRSEVLPRGLNTWRMLLLQAFFTSIGAWSLLAWGQQHVAAGLASVLNSTSPLFVFIITAFITRHEASNPKKLLGAMLGLCGVVLIVGIDALAGLGSQVWGQLACLAGALLYACAAIYGKQFSHISALATATGTLIMASCVMLPLALWFEQPWQLSPSSSALVAVSSLSIVSTALAMLIYFRLVKSLGSMAVASQAYLRASVGVCLGMVFLGESVSTPVALGLVLSIVGVALINWPSRQVK